MSVVDTGNIFREANSLVDKVQDKLHDEASQHLTGIADGLEGKAQDLLEASMGSVYTETQRITSRLEAEVDDIDAKISLGLERVEKDMDGALQKARNRLGELLGQIEDGVSDLRLLADQPTEELLRRIAWNSMAVGGVLILLLGLVIIVGAVILAKGWPGGVGGIIAGVLVIALLALGGALAFVPQARELVLRYLLKSKPETAIPPTPRIFNVDPNPFFIGEDRELHIRGVHLVPVNLRPQVTINEIQFDILAAGENQITIDLPGELLINSLHGNLWTRTAQLTLTYTGGLEIGAPVLFAYREIPAGPALIALSDFFFTPASPKATQDIVHASVTVENSGESPSLPFQLTWLPAPHGAQNTLTVPSLSARESSCFTIPSGFTYREAGSFQTELRSNSPEMGDNPPFLSGTITVEPLPAPDPVLENATVIFHTQDDDKKSSTDVSIIVHNRYKLVPQNFPDILVWLQTETLYGSVSGFGFPDGATNEVDLVITRPMKRSELSYFKAWIKITPHPSLPTDSEGWRFDWSLRLQFEGEPAPVLIEYESAHLGDDYVQLERNLPVLHPFPLMPGVHFYTADLSERNTAVMNYQFISQGIACYVFPSQEPGTVPLYRLYNQGNRDHFYTTSEIERDFAVDHFNYASEGTAGYVFASLVPGAVPLYRLLSPVTGEHFFTASLAERVTALANFGYCDEGVTGYVFDSNRSGTVPFYRLFKLI